MLWEEKSNFLLSWTLHSTYIYWHQLLDLECSVWSTATKALCILNSKIKYVHYIWSELKRVAKPQDRIPFWNVNLQVRGRYPKLVYHEHTSLVEFANARIMQRKLSTVWKSTKREDPGILFIMSLIFADMELVFWSLLDVYLVSCILWIYVCGSTSDLQGRRRYKVIGKIDAETHHVGLWQVCTCNFGYKWQAHMNYGGK